MQHKCAQHKWDHFIRNYKTNIRFKKNEHMIKPTEKEGKEKHFFTLSSQC